MPSATNFAWCFKGKNGNLFSECSRRWDGLGVGRGGITGGVGGGLWQEKHLTVACMHTYVLKVQPSHLLC